jgi:PAS domain S-box-containing protein
MNNTESRETMAIGDDISYSKLIKAASGYAIFFISPDGHIEDWPDTAEHLYRYGSDEVLDEPLDALWADEGEFGNSGSDDTLSELLEQANGGDVTVERWHRRRDGSVFWATTTVAPVLNDVLHGYTVVSYDTTSRKQYERMLEHQNDRLKEFTDILSHDLQSPLATVDGSLALYRHTGDGQYLENVDETVRRMKALVEDLLRVARQGDVVRDPTPTDLGDVIAVARRGTLPRGAVLEYDPVPGLMAEEARLVQLFENVFRNAGDHASENPTVRVGPLADGGFYVEDDGPGVPEEIRHEVFDHGFTTRRGGHGFGLSVVRTIANAHGWDVRVTDGSSGGARFEFTGAEPVDV